MSFRRKNNPFLEGLKSKTIDMNKRVKEIQTSLQFYYDSNIQDIYKEHFAFEYKILKAHFPEIDFTYEGRIKNKNSLEEKIHRKLSQGNTGNIYDIFGKKIIVYSINGYRNEESLKEACYRISVFLSTYDSALIDVPDKRKDYITYPKANGYQAIHLIRKHFTIDDNKENELYFNYPKQQRTIADIKREKNVQKTFFSEVHIRTFRMEEHQKFGTASHLLSYKPSETLKKELCPTFLEIGKNGKTYELSKKASFAKYKSDYDAIQEYFDMYKLK